MSREYKERKKSAGIFQIKNTENNKVLLGSSLNLDGPLNRHKFLLTTGSHPNKLLQKEWNEYGSDKFIFEILEVVEVNEDEMVMIVEPGVTFGMIRSYLDKHHPGYRYTYPLAPPQTSALSNALLDGLNNLSMKHGAMAEWISGMEVVLPTGELIRVGSCAVVDSWHSRAPLPDLAGLFLGWQGSTGIVVRDARVRRGSIGRIHKESAIKRKCHKRHGLRRRASSPNTSARCW